MTITATFVGRANTCKKQPTAAKRKIFAVSSPGQDPAEVAAVPRQATAELPSDMAAQREGQPPEIRARQRIGHPITCAREHMVDV